MHRCGSSTQRYYNATTDQPGQGDQQRQHQRYKYRTIDQRLLELFIDIIDIDAGTDDPTPGFEAFHIGELGGQRSAIPTRTALGFGPEIIDKTFTVFTHHPDKFAIETLAFLVFKIANLFTVQRRFERMHHHPRSHIIEPEILAVFVTQLSNHRNSARLRFLH